MKKRKTGKEERERDQLGERMEKHDRDTRDELRRNNIDPDNSAARHAFLHSRYRET